MNYEKSLEDLKKSIIELQEKNKIVPIIVEGEKDVDALHKLDINGKIITINSGLSIPDFCDKIADEYNEIIILTDWDRKGGFLCHTILRNLKGRVICNTRFREVFAKNAKIKTVEGLPSWISTMNEKLRL